MASKLKPLDENGNPDLVVIWSSLLFLRYKSPIILKRMIWQYGERKHRRRESLLFRLPLALFFLACVLLYGCSSTGKKQTGPEAAAYKSAIQRVVDANGELIRDRFEALNQSRGNRSEAFRIYADYGRALRSIDMTECPVEFQVAFLEYIHSIEDVSAKMAKEPEGLKWETLLGLIEFNPMAVIKIVSEIGRPQKERTAIRKEVESSVAKSQERWRKIELIAVQYGVRFQVPV
jgi:hypothetical protein